MTEGTKKILDTREDYSDFIFHFTKGANAFINLENIIASGTLFAGEDGNICFTEAPLNLLCANFDYFMNNYPNNQMYAPFGIGLRKSYMFDLGARHVIYGDLEDKKKIPIDMHWRFVYYNPKDYEYSWLREWRLHPIDGWLNLSPDEAIIVVDKKERLNFLPLGYTDVELDGDIEDGGEFHATATVKEKRYKFIVLDSIRNKPKRTINEVLDNQEVEEILNQGSY